MDDISSHCCLRPDIRYIRHNYAIRFSTGATEFHCLRSLSLAQFIIWTRWWYAWYL